MAIQPWCVSTERLVWTHCSTWWPTDWVSKCHRLILSLDGTGAAGPTWPWGKQCPAWTDNKTTSNVLTMQGSSQLKPSTLFRKRWQEAHAPKKANYWKKTSRSFSWNMRRASCFVKFRDWKQPFAICHHKVAFFDCNREEGAKPADEKRKHRVWTQRAEKPSPHFAEIGSDIHSIFIHTYPHTHTPAHTHTDIYIYCVCVCSLFVQSIWLGWSLQCHTKTFSGICSTPSVIGGWVHIMRSMPVLISWVFGGYKYEYFPGLPWKQRFVKVFDSKICIWPAV